MTERESYVTLDAPLIRRASGDAVLMVARHEGLGVMASEDWQRSIWGPESLKARWAPYLAAKKADVLRELLFGICDRCGTGNRLTEAYWLNEYGWHEACAECVAERTEKFDRDGWPVIRWGEPVDVVEL